MGVAELSAAGDPRHLTAWIPLLGARTELPTAVSRRKLTAWIQRNTYPTVVWLQGEDDSSEVAALCETLAEAISLTDADQLVVDLSGVDSMSSATIVVILTTRDLLRDRSRSLVLRSPSTAARHLYALAESPDNDRAARPAAETAVAR